MKKSGFSLVILIIVAMALLLAGLYTLWLVKPIKLENMKKTLGENTPTTLKPQKNQPVTLVAVGDISYSREVGRQVRSHKDINYPFLKTNEILEKGDITFANLETPITPGREIQDGEMVFRSNPGTEKALKNAGIDVVSLANNHTMNFGETGIIDTFKYLQNENIKYVGAGENSKKAYSPLYIETKGTKIAFLAYTDSGMVPAGYEAEEGIPGIAFMNTQEMVSGVKTARQKADFVIVSMHAGTEYTQHPNNLQINFAHAAIDAGADMIIGHHPHAVQTAEIYKDKYIFYSLGNFVFDQMWSTETRQGLILEITLDKLKTKDPISVKYIPVISQDYCQPNLAEGETAQNILTRLEIKK